MLPILEAVPNFSEGRDLDRVQELVRAVEGAGADVLDWSADPDHDRSVITFVGAPEVVEEAAVAAARTAAELIDLRRHRGVHPRVGALDVLPFVALSGLSLEDAVTSARRVGHRLSEAGLPVYWYAEASEPPGRALASLRRGGYEAIRDEFPEGREPDLLPEGWQHPGAHPTAGATCVGARPLLLAWNVDVEGVPSPLLREIALEIRASGGGFPALRALPLELDQQRRVQISMNLEDLQRSSPMEVFRAIEERVRAAGGRVTGTEVIGMAPTELVLEAAADRLALRDVERERLLAEALADHAARRAGDAARDLADAVENAGPAVPDEVRRAAERLQRHLLGVPVPGEAR